MTWLCGCTLNLGKVEWKVDRRNLSFLFKFVGASYCSLYPRQAVYSVPLTWFYHLWQKQSWTFLKSPRLMYPKDCGDICILLILIYYYCYYCYWNKDRCNVLEWIKASINSHGKVGTASWNLTKEMSSHVLISLCCSLEESHHHMK